MAIQNMESREWGCRDTIFPIKEYIFFKERLPWLLRYGHVLGSRDQPRGRALPQYFVDFALRRWWASYVKDVTNVSVQSLGTGSLDQERKPTLNETIGRLYNDPDACSYTQLRAILGEQIDLDTWWQESPPPPIGPHEMARFDNNGVPLTREHAQVLLARMLLHDHFRSCFRDLLRDGCLPDLRSDCIVKYGQELYRVSDLENSENKPVFPVTPGRSRARRSEGGAILAAQISIGVLGFDSGECVWHETPLVNGAVEAGDTGDIGSEFLSFASPARSRAIIEIAVKRETDRTPSKKPVSAFRGELLKLAINTRREIKSLC
jgi:hypothetical protein